MPRYLVRAMVETPVCVRDIRKLGDSDALGRFNFDMQYPNQVVRVSVSDNYSGTVDLPEYHGLIVDVECTASDVGSATELALNHADSVMTMMSLATASYVGVPKLQFAYDITEGASPREYVMHVPLEHARRTVQRPAPAARVGPIFKSFSEHEKKGHELASEKKRERHYALARAVRWLRKAFGEIDAVDAFIQFWIALEALDYVLPRPKVQILPSKCNSCGVDLDPCPACGAKSGAAMSTSPLLAIQALCERNGYSKQRFLKLRDLRAAIIHARAMLSGTGDALIERAKVDLPTVRGLAIAGVCEAYAQFGLPSRIAEEIQQLVPISEDYETWVRLRIYVADTPDFESKGGRETPSIEVTQKLERVSVSDEGKLIIKGKVGFALRGCSLPAGYPHEVELWSKAPLDAGGFSEENDP